ncbi:hypothetical protein P4B35_16995 [Pontiellaceae bacterium B12227]|nr:hypothetical protein [Pontiellaceae bacterium B12227]
MEQERVNVMYDENGKAVRVQMDFDLYQWMIQQLPQAEQALAVAS